MRQPEIPPVEKENPPNFSSPTGPAARVAEASPSFPQPGGVELPAGAKFTPP